ncbi:MAG: hypothetical protein IKB01_06390 [Lachnospiraceae bacterium]|nr:hypothetical protein [Lachnospiraceae bacterium]
MKKIVSFVVLSILMLCSLTACAEKFDASGYVKAVLDNGYYNDSTGILEMGLSTAEDAEAVYNKGVESLVDITLSAITVSEDLEEEYRQFYKDLFAGAKYTVGEAVEVDENTFEVPVTCEKLNVYANANASYEAELETLVAVWTEAALAGEEVPSDEEKYEHFFILYKDCLKAELAKGVYGAPVTVNVKVENVEGIWTLNADDRLNLEYELIDLKEMF